MFRNKRNIHNSSVHTISLMKRIIHLEGVKETPYHIIKTKNRETRREKMEKKLIKVMRGKNKEYMGQGWGGEDREVTRMKG